MSTSDPMPHNGRNPGRWILLAIAVVCLLPLAAAVYLRFISPPALTPITGKALKPFVFPYESLKQMDGQPMAHPAVSDHWLIVQIQAKPCAAACRGALYLTRQARIAQGRRMDRIQRILIVSNSTPPASDLLSANPDLHLFQTTDQRVEQLLANGTLSGSPPIYLVDRRGFVVFRYEATVAPEIFIRELGKLVAF